MIDLFEIYRRIVNENNLPKYFRFTHIYAHILCTEFNCGIIITL